VKEDAAMIDWMMSNYQRNYQFLSKAVTNMTGNQWRLLATQSQFGIDLWNAMLGVFPPVGSSGEPQGEVVASGSASLESRATERLKRGFAPPREIYDVQNRGRIDWSSLPDWARPVDPEVFEGGHEG
jgi:hypothetical protein